MENLIVLALAIVLDAAFGDPRNALHPVAWLGRLIGLAMKPAPRQGKARQYVYGMFVVLIVTVAVTAAAYFSLVYVRMTSQVAFIVLSSLILKATFALRGLGVAARKIRALLSGGDLDRARFELRALVGRDTTQLGRPEMVSAVVESVAENSCDAFVAPLFYFAVFGVPGAVAYRVINTFDSMIGHHGRWEYLGKFAARLDSILNFIPARLSALMIAAAAGLCRLDTGGAWRTMLRDRVRTESPNAGWTMSAAAGALGVRLEKIGFYALGESRSELTPERIDESLRLYAVQAGIWAVVCAGVVVMKGVFFASQT